jgi:hypothetical protein
MSFLFSLYDLQAFFQVLLLNLRGKGRPEATRIGVRWIRIVGIGRRCHYGFRRNAPDFAITSARRMGAGDYNLKGTELGLGQREIEKSEGSVK